MLSGDPATAKTCYCIQVFWYFVLPDVSLLAAIGRFLDDFWWLRFCYSQLYRRFLALCTSCDLLIKSIFGAILYVSAVNGVLLDPFWLQFTRFLSKKWFFVLAKLEVYPSIQGLVPAAAPNGAARRIALPKRGWNPTSPAHVPRMTWVAQGKLPQTIITIRIL